MHRCLAVFEIVELIAHIAEDKAGNPWCRLLPSPAASLALTCRAFYEPASNVHWSELKSFVPLLRLFLANRPGSSSLKGPVSLESFSQAANPESWARFLHHARRVRKLACRWPWHVVAYLKVLYRFRPDEVSQLLPGLQSFTCIVTDAVSDSTYPVKALAHTGLRTLRIVYHVTPINHPSLEFLGTHAPMLRRFEVSSCSYFAADTRFLASAARSLIPTFASELLPRLNTLVYNTAPLPADVFCHLAKLPGLKSLNASIVSESVGLLPWDDPKLFPALRFLWLHASANFEVTRLLQSLSSRRLETVDLFVGEQPTSTVFTEWTKLLSKQRYLSQVEVCLHYSIFLGIANLHTSAEYLINDAAIRPLLALHRITNLSLRDFPLTLTNQLIEDIAFSWRHLKQLSLGVTNMMGPQTSSVTLQGLRPLSARCPKLLSLAMPMNMLIPPVTPFPSRRRWFPQGSSRRRSVLPSPVKALTGTPSAAQALDVSQTNDCDRTPKCMSLKAIDIGYSVISDPSAVALFLSECFPNLERIRDFSDTAKQSDKVNKLLRKYKNCR